MKANWLSARITSLLFVLPLLLFSTCKDEVTRTRTFRTMVPIYLSVADLRAQTTTIQAPEPLTQPGKIYIFGNYLFITEIRTGIHVVDNTNPAAPRFINFISIPGNADMAVNSNILYADTYVDLLAFDVSNPANIIPVKRVENVFDNLYIDKAKGLILGYRDTVITEVVRGDIAPNKYYDYESGAFSSNTPGSNSVGGSNYGTGGSTARFTLMNSNLYTVDHYQLKLFNVSQPRDPKYINTINLGGGIETIFPYDNKLFIGSTTGMHIYDASNPSAPVKLSTYRHVTSCDPVVVQGKFAYVTLRSDNFCQQGINVLQVLNIEDARNPVMVSTFPMLKPYGLAVSGKNLFICEGQFGLKAFDNSDVLSVGQKQLSFLENINASDVIAGPKSLIVTGSGGVYQYNYSNASDLKLLSHLPLNNSL